ncbi:hypothetical protein OG21DRAFT_221837 [Imleria badia]|nr:hypothetical protein OG21DRAFT_221837 [Imleria badia]
MIRRSGDRSGLATLAVALLPLWKPPSPAHPHPLLWTPARRRVVLAATSCPAPRPLFLRVAVKHENFRRLETAPRRLPCLSLRVLYTALILGEGRLTGIANGFDDPGRPLLRTLTQHRQPLIFPRTRICIVIITYTLALASSSILLGNANLNYSRDTPGHRMAVTTHGAWAARCIRVALRWASGTARSHTAEPVATPPVRPSSSPERPQTRRRPAP